MKWTAVIRRNVWVALMGLALSVASRAEAQSLDTITEQDFINGKMTIDFGTRTNLDTAGDYVEGSSAKGSQDVYELQMNVAKTTEYAGKIIRKPRLVTRLLGKEEQPASLAYDIAVAVRNPNNLSQKKTVGKWVGGMTIDQKGNYDLSGVSQLRMVIDAVGKSPAFVGNFGGRIVGKSQVTQGLVDNKISEYSRIIQGKKIKIQVKNADPLRFNNLVLGEGPAQVYPKTTVNGNLDYDYETGNWYTNGIKMKYSVNGLEIEDHITGSIKWVEDPDRASNGKGQYEFNLRFNEGKSQTATDESAAFSDTFSADEAAFFEVDDSIPSMTGTIAYVDTMSVEAGADEPTVTASQITYNLHANKLTKQQAVNLFKLWLVIVGPTNDE